jgi:hypothetical protein
MKKLLFSLLAGVLVSSPSNAMSIDQLQSGAAAAVIHDIKGSAMTPDQFSDCMVFMGYYWGFFHAAHNRAFLSQYVEKQVHFQEAKWMSDFPRVASSISAFLREHKPKSLTEKREAGKVMTAWFLWNSEDTTGDAKFASIYLLREEFGADFPGSKEMIVVMAEEKRKHILQKREAPSKGAPAEEGD